MRISMQHGGLGDVVGVIMLLGLGNESGRDLLEFGGQLPLLFLLCSGLSLFVVQHSVLWCVSIYTSRQSILQNVIVQF